MQIKHAIICKKEKTVERAVYDPILRDQGGETYHVDMKFFAQKLDLRLGQSCETKHADLIRNMLPRPGRSLLLEPCAHSPAHIRNATTHRLQITLPRLEQLRVVQDTAGDMCAIRRRIGDLGALQHGKLGGDVVRGAGGIGARGGDEVEGTRALTVETKVLGEGLGDAELEA